MIDGTNSRVEQELTGAEYPAPISRLERIIDGEDIKPLSRIEDKMKQYIAGGGGGGLEVLTQEQYDALSDEEKLDSEKAYYVTGSTHISVNIKRVSEDNDRISCSTYNSDATAAWKAFNGISPSSYSSITNCWIATSEDETPWIGYEFNNGTLVNNVTVKFATYRAYTGDKFMKVQGSNDKTTWTDLATVELDITTEFGATTIEIPISNNTTVYKYWRLYFPQKIYGNPSTTLFVDEIYMEGTEPIAATDIIYHEDVAYRVGNKIVNMGSKTNYDALSVNQKMNGDVYFVDSDRTAILLELTNGYIQKESDMSYVSVTEYDCKFIFISGSQIGANVSYSIPIDVTDIDYIYYDLELGSCYGNGSQVQQDKWCFCIGVTDTLRTGLYGDYAQIDYTEFNKYSETNKTYKAEALDVSELTGNYYITVYAPGWNAEWHSLYYNIDISSKQMFYIGDKYIRDYRNQQYDI